MRIKAVLRDAEILSMEPGSQRRIVAAALKNIDRTVNLGSLLKVMGLPPDGRIQMLTVLANEPIHIWLTKDGDQHVIHMSRAPTPADPEFSGYMWQ
ncbi:MAG: hypothetical protein QXS20_10225 [Candidatus Thorarchaeota archaeon]